MRSSSKGKSLCEVPRLFDRQSRKATLPLPRGTFLGWRRRQSLGAPLVPIAGDFAIPRLQDAKISLEVFDAGAGFAPVSAATRRHAFARSLDGQQLKIFDR
jgi:hypothetical protein